MGGKKADKKATKTANPAAKKAGSEAAVAKIAAMPAPNGDLGQRLHALVLRCAPTLQPTLWYGMPAYAKDGRVICFFPADKYMTFGLTDKANHDIEKGAPHQLRESAWFFTSMDDANEAKLCGIVKGRELRNTKGTDDEEKK